MLPQTGAGMSVNFIKKPPKGGFFVILSRVEGLRQKPEGPCSDIPSFKPFILFKHLTPSTLIPYFYTLLQLPRQRTCTENSRIRLFQMADKNLHFILEYLDQVGLHMLTGRFQDKITGLGQTTE